MGSEPLGPVHLAMNFPGGPALSQAGAQPPGWDVGCALHNPGPARWWAANLKPGSSPHRVPPHSPAFQGRGLSVTSHALRPHPHPALLRATAPPWASAGVVCSAPWQRLSSPLEWRGGVSPSSLPILPARQAHLSLVLGTASAPPKGQVVDLSPATLRPGDGPAQVLGPPLTHPGL